MNNIPPAGLVLSCPSWDFWMPTGTVATGMGWIDLTPHDCIGIFSCFTLHWTGARVASVLTHNGLGSKLLCSNSKSALGWWTGELSPLIRNC